MGVKVREVKRKGWYVFINWRNQRKAKSFSSKEAARAFAKKLEARLKWADVSGEPLALSQPEQQMPTVKAYLTDWLKTYAQVHCKPSTAAGYQQDCVKHVFPAIGDRPLHEVSRAHVKRLIATWWSHGLKKRTIHNILTPLKEAYQHAIDDGLLTVNPVSNMGRALRSRDSADAHIDPLTAEEVRTVLQQAKQTAPLLYPLFLCAVRTGMRQGELLGLQWGDIDFHGQFIEVRRAIVRRQETTTKTHKIRRVDMSPQLANALSVLRETRECEAAMHDRPLAPWIFLGPTERRVSNELVRNAFRTCLTAAGLRLVRFHDLRHTFASLLIQQGANVKYIQQQLGHGSISITLDIYSHLFHGDHRHHVHQLDDPPERTEQTGEVPPESATQPQPAQTGYGMGCWK
ncbi:MAG TPA: site-specific integrase [Candidatus Acidoferrales bacterium]|nr:site-specific integrase [Candidatus Acidoferrales bacterium]